MSTNLWTVPLRPDQERGIRMVAQQVTLPLWEEVAEVTEAGRARARTKPSASSTHWSFGKAILQQSHVFIEHHTYQQH